MKLVIQRVQEASVTIENKIVGSISKGLLVLIGIETKDSEVDVDWCLSKLVNMRIFSDEEGKMNLSLLEVNGKLLVVSQFTLHASTKKGNRPSFITAARPEQAIPLYDSFIQKISIIIDTCLLILTISLISTHCVDINNY